MDEQQNVNIMFHKLGGQLIDKGIYFERNAFKLNPQFRTKSEIVSFLNQQTGIPVGSLSIADEKIYIEKWDKWLSIIEFDLINYQKYVADFRDCDNYAFIFAARAGMIYGLNSCGAVFGSTYDPITKKFLNRHAFNLIVVYEQDGLNYPLKLYLYEPQTDNYILWQASKDNILESPNWIYKPDWIILF